MFEAWFKILSEFPGSYGERIEICLPGSMSNAVIRTAGAALEVCFQVC